MTRFHLAAMAALALLVSACGVSREPSADAIASGEVDTTLGTDGADGSSDGTDGFGADGSDPATPPTTAPADDVAADIVFEDGRSLTITHGDMNAIVVPSQENDLFVERVFGGSRPPDFELGILQALIEVEAVRAELDQRGLETVPADLFETKEQVQSEVANAFFLADSADEAEANSRAESFIDEVPWFGFLIEYQTEVQVLFDALAADAGPGEGNPCVRHILVTTEAEAEAALVRLADGEDFGALAQEVSTGPSGPNGGDLGCAPSSNYVPEFAAAVDGAVEGEFVGPVQTEFGFHVLVVDRYEVDGQSLGTEVLRTRLGAAEVDIDERLGSWDPASSQIIAAGS